MEDERLEAVLLRIAAPHERGPELGGRWETLEQGESIHRHRHCPDEAADPTTEERAHHVLPGVYSRFGVRLSNGIGTVGLIVSVHTSSLSPRTNVIVFPPTRSPVGPLHSLLAGPEGNVTADPDRSGPGREDGVDNGPQKEYQARDV